MGDVMNREEFEKWYLALDIEYRNLLKDLPEITASMMFMSWQHQQKIIDELNEKLSAKEKMIVCIQDIREKQENEIDGLKAEIKHLQDSAQKCLDTLGKYGI